MSEVKRYSLTLHKVKGKFKSPEFKRDNGEWVRWQDYARLQAEVERLRKVGDEMATLFGGDYSDIDGVCYDKKWLAAKEGRD